MKLVKGNILIDASPELEGFGISISPFTNETRLGNPALVTNNMLKILYTYGFDRFSNGDFLITDINQNKFARMAVSDFTSSATWSIKWLKEDMYGTENGKFSQMADVVIDSRDYIYILDLQRGIVQVFDQFGNFISKITSESIGGVSVKITALRKVRQGGKDYLFLISDRQILGMEI